MVGKSKEMDEKSYPPFESRKFRRKSPSPSSSVISERCPRHRNVSSHLLAKLSSIKSSCLSCAMASPSKGTTWTPGMTPGKKPRTWEVKNCTSFYIILPGDVGWFRIIQASWLPLPVTFRLPSSSVGFYCPFCWPSCASGADLRWLPWLPSGRGLSRPIAGSLRSEQHNDSMRWKSFTCHNGHIT